MITSAVSDGPEVLEQPTFVYAKCGHTETTTLASDPSGPTPSAGSTVIAAAQVTGDNSKP
jgi:hypothetical protein